MAGVAAYGGSFLRVAGDAAAHGDVFFEGDRVPLRNRAVTVLALRSGAGVGLVAEGHERWHSV